MGKVPFAEIYVPDMGCIVQGISETEETDSRSSGSILSGKFTLELFHPVFRPVS